MKTNADYQRDSRQRRIDLGLVRWDVWATPPQMSKLKRYAAELGIAVTKKIRRTP